MFLCDRIHSDCPNENLNERAVRRLPGRSPDLGQFVAVGREGAAVVLDQPVACTVVGVGRVVVGGATSLLVDELIGGKYCSVYMSL